MLADTKESEQLLKLGTKIRILSGPFKDETGKIVRMGVGHHPSDVLVRLDSGAVVTHISKGKFEIIEMNELHNIYRRYMRIRMEAFIDVLELLHDCASVGKAKQKIRSYLEDRKEMAFDSLSSYYASLPNLCTKNNENELIKQVEKIKDYW